MEREELWGSWLTNAIHIQASHGNDVKYFVAIQVDERGREPFQTLTDMLDYIGGEYWFYSLDDGRTAVTGANRLRHICAGLNLIADFATTENASHILHMAADCEPPRDALPKLLEVRNGIAAASCSTYFSYDNTELWQDVGDYPFRVVDGPMAAVCVLIARGLFKRLKWRWDPDLGMSDDPSYTYDATTLLNVRTLTRTDCVALHNPRAIGPIDRRYSGVDLSLPSAAAG